MGAYTTISVTRSTAKELLIRSLMLDTPDSRLELFMDELLDHQLYNCRIVPDDAQNEDHLIDQP